jgi:hypothetical protein
VATASENTMEQVEAYILSQKTKFKQIREDLLYPPFELFKFFHKIPNRFPIEIGVHKG